MENNFLHNVFGVAVSEPPHLRDVSFAKKNENGKLVPNYTVGEYTDEDGFDLRNIEANGLHKIDIRLAKGTRLCRYGNEAGRYTTYVGSAYEQLALPWDINSVQYHEYEVIADGLEVELVVTKGIVGPQEAFRSSGGAVQFLHKCSIRQEVEENRTLRRINYEDEIGRRSFENPGTSDGRNDQPLRV